MSDGVTAFEAEIERLEAAVAESNARLLQIEASRFFRLLRVPGQIRRDWRGRLGQALLHSPLHTVYLKLVRPRKAQEAYSVWVDREQATMPGRGWFDAAARQFRSHPTISVVMPVHNPRREWLEAAVESVRGQSWQHWELCVCDDASRDAWVQEYLALLSSEDRRVRFVRSENGLGIAGASNRAGELATGEYIGFLDQDDILAPAALHSVAEALQAGPADLLYTDEDRLDHAGRRVEPVFKPAWSPDLLLSCMYLGHFLVARRQALERAGWLRSAFDGSQDYDMALRIADAGGAVRHIPRVLYHWRKHAGSTAANISAKPYSHAAGLRALADTVARRGYDAKVENGPAPNTYHLRRQPAGAPLASIVVCSRNARLLNRCLRALTARTDYGRREIIVVEHLTGDGDALARVAARYGCRRTCYSGPFDFAAMCNLGARAAAGEVLVFLNDDVTPLGPGWLAAMLAQVLRPEVGVVGARLLYPNGAIQHAGLVIGIMNGVGHLQRHTCGSGYWNWWPFARNVSAVTGACLAIRKSLFDELGGFSAAFPVNYNDADLCLRASGAGYRIVYEPAATLRHIECRTRRPGVDYAERALWARRWGDLLDSGDPYYNPNLSDHSEDAGLHGGCTTPLHPPR